MRKPMNIINNDEYYGDFLLSLQLHQKDLEAGKMIPMEDVKEAMEPYYSSLARPALHGYRSWIHANSEKIAHDIKKVLKYGPKAIIAPVNELKRIQFDKYVTAIKGLCILPSDVDDIVKHRASEVAHAMYSDGQAKKKLMSIKNYLKKNYRDLKSAIEKQMAKKNKKTSATSSSSTSSSSSASVSSSGEEP